MADAVATVGFQDKGTEVLSTTGGVSKGLLTPIRGFRFTASFDGLGTTSFKEVQGFSTEVETTEYREGGFGYLTKRKLPGLVTFGDITLIKGLYYDPTLYQYFDAFLRGTKRDPVNGSIVVYDNAFEPQASWTVINAWPKSCTMNDLNAEDSSILIETLVLAHEGISRDSTVAAGL